MNSVAGLVLLGLVCLLVGAALFLFVLGLGLLRWARVRSVLYLLPILFLSAALVTAGVLQLSVYLVPDFATMVSSTGGRRFALLQAGGESGTLNLVLGLAFLGVGILAGHLFHAGTQNAVREGHRRRRQARKRQTVQLFAASESNPRVRRGTPVTARGASKAASTVAPGRGAKSRRARDASAQPAAHGGWLLRLGFKR